MRRVVTLMVAWALSPATTLLNAGLVAFVLFLAGADPHRPLFWVAPAVYLAAALPYDVTALVTQHRRGLSSLAVAEAVVERLWPSRAEEVEQ